MKRMEDLEEKTEQDCIEVYFGDVRKSNSAIELLGKRSHMVTSPEVIQTFNSDNGDKAYFCNEEKAWHFGMPHAERHEATRMKGTKMLWTEVYSCKECNAYLGYTSGTTFVDKRQ